MEFCITHNIMVWVYWYTGTNMWYGHTGMRLVMCLCGNRVSHIPLPASNFSTDLVICESMTHLPS